MRRGLAFVVILSAGMAQAAPSQTLPPKKTLSQEDAYVAARDRAIAAMKTVAARGGDKVDAQERRLRASLEAQLKRLVGPTPPRGFSGTAAMSPATLVDSDIGADALDGMTFSTPDQKGSVLVTTEGLARRWLRARKSWGKDETVPTDLAAALRTESFYTHSVSVDAAVSIFAPLPIRTPAGAGAAVAFLVEVSQDVPTEPPGDIAVSVIKDGKLFVTVAGLRQKLPQIAACAGEQKRIQAKAEAALAAYNASERKNQAKFDEYTQLQNDGAAALQKCWAARVARESGYPAVLRQAQQLADGFAELR